MQRFLNYFIDFLFPPSKEEFELRVLSPEDFLLRSPKAGPTEFPFISSLFSYKDPLVRELIWQIKYRKNKHTLAIAAYALSKNIPPNTLLIPIPISEKRRKERGYNQCELILDELSKLGDFKVDYSLLRRAKDIEKQTFKNRNERIENTKNIFEVTRTENEKILIIDDVSTTGSTLKEARRALLDAGFKEVYALTIAH